MKYSLLWINNVNQVNAEAWNILARPLPTPFFEWEWLDNLESSGSANHHTGWAPRHLVVKDENQKIVAIAPLYLKGHSQGEFVFDHQFADLAYRLGIKYYPKLLGMSPFTPAGAYQFMFHPDCIDQTLITDLMLTEIDRFCIKQKIASCNFLYVDQQWQSTLTDRGFTAWMHHSYIWKNQNFGTFDDFLQGFNANQRRNIKRERKSVTNAAITMRTYTNDSIPPHFFSYMYELYSDHCDKFMWGSRYLTKTFFENLKHDLKQYVVFFAGQKEEQTRPEGMSFCICKGDQLFGRYWGCRQEIDSLHFDACYYSPIEWAIAQGIQQFDPGAGGEHKKRRGFPATANFSLHRFYYPILNEILIPYIQKYNEYETAEIDAINQELPFDISPPQLDNNAPNNNS